MVTDRFAETAEAFDSVAATYDGPQGNNHLIQRMREITWAVFADRFPPGSRVLDIGAGTGIDAEEMTRRGYRVHATDWSPEMVERCRARAERLSGLTAERCGAQELHTLAERHEVFDGAYSNFGPLNCVDDLPATAAALARLVRPGGHAVFGVMGRICPWEVGRYVAQRRFGRATVRFRRGQTPVGMNGHTVWTRYFTPGEFNRAFLADFEVVEVRALSLFVPPPYMTTVGERWPRAHAALVRVDDTVGTWPLFRSAGDHFLTTLRRR